MKLNHTLDLNATKRLKTQCIEVDWHKFEPGACFVRYDVKFQNASGSELYKTTVYNIGEIKICNLTKIFNITDISVMASFKDARVSSTVRLLAERLLPPTLQPRIIEECKKTKIP